MNLIKRFSSSFLILFVFGVLFLPLLVNAQTPCNPATDLCLVFEPPCVKIGITSFDTCTPIGDMQTYIKRLYQFAVGISGIVAVGMIVYGAIIIVVKSENVIAKSEGKQIIQDALWGVLLLFASYLLLNTINPELVKLKEPTTGSVIATSTTSQLTQLSASSCGMSLDIPAISDNEIYSRDGNANPPMVVEKALEPNNRCALRRVLLQHGGDITDNGNESQNYYYENEGYEKNTIAWTYPYYLKGSDPKTTARCIIYAIREPSDDPKVKAETVMVDLNSQITPCLLDDIPTSTIKDKFEIDVPKPIKQLPGWIWGNDPASITSNAFGSKATPENLEKARKAMDDLSKRSSVTFDGSGTCSPSSDTSPSGIKAAVLAKNEPLVCDPSCSCSKKGITISPNLLSKLDALAQKKAFTINSLTGGPHSAGSSHYSGLAVDISPKDSSENGYKYLKTDAASIFGSSGNILCEAYFTESDILKIKDLKQSNGVDKYSVTKQSSDEYTILKNGNFARCKKYGDKFHCMNTWDQDCSPAFFEAGHSGNHLHIQVPNW